MRCLGTVSKRWARAYLHQQQRQAKHTCSFLFPPAIIVKLGRVAAVGLQIRKQNNSSTYKKLH
jgi:hypothetical protein